MKFHLLLYFLVISLRIIKTENNTQEFINDENNIQEIIYNNAKSYIGSDLWGYLCSNDDVLKYFEGKERLSFNEKVFFCSYEPKCNLFVYEMLEKSGITIDLPNKMGGKCSTLQLLNFDVPKERPPTASQWYNGTVENMKLIGIGEEGLSKAIRGDILTNGHHMGIISGYNKTISARCDVIVENEYGWDDNSTKIFRYEGGLDSLDESSEDLINYLGAKYYTSKIINTIIFSLLL